MEQRGNQEKSYKKVINYIKNQIKIGELTMGCKLPTERDLSEILGISRNSVREALRTLENMGVITSHQGAGNFLTGNFEKNLVESLSMMFLLDQLDYQQISQLRRALEMEALMLAIDNISDEEIQVLKQIIAQLEKETEENNVILDKRMHYNIALASKNTLIINILEALSEVLDKFIVDLRREILIQEDSRAVLMEAHNGMVESLVTRNKSLAYEAINKHFGVIDEKLKENEIKTV